MPISGHFPGGGTDTSDATATAGDILKDKTAYVNDTKITGSIVAKTSTDLTASGATVTAPAGYYASDVSKAVTTATQATPSISVSTAGLITATDTQTAGYVAAGTKSATQQMAVQAAQTITPSTSAQTIAAQKYLTGDQTISGDANLLAANILSGKSIFGVAGSAVDGSSMKNYAHGIGTSSTDGTVSVTGLAFTPNLVIVTLSDSYLSTCIRSSYGSNFSAYDLRINAGSIVNMSTSLAVSTTSFSGKFGSVSAATSFTWNAFS
jgi:hypothetical protein